MRFRDEICKGDGWYGVPEKITEYGGPKDNFVRKIKYFYVIEGQVHWSSKIVLRGPAAHIACPAKVSL